MNWDDQLTRIRRFLRDPDGDIWSESLIVRLYTDELNDLYGRCGHIELVRSIKIPPNFISSYLYDWEWPFSDSADGDVIGRGYDDDYNLLVASNVWEVQQGRGLTPDVPSLGSFCVHPWEGFMETPNEQPPISLPAGFHDAKAMFFDKEPLSPTTLREVQDRDPSWRSREGVPDEYYRDEEYSNRVFLHPRPSSFEWQDGYQSDLPPDSAEYAGDNTLDVDNNILAIFTTDASSSSGFDNEYPEFLFKYVEAGVIEHAYRMNTDGRIESLADYWKTRKQMGIAIIKRYMSSRNVDRVYQMGSPSFVPRQRRHPRLPDEYPETNP